MTNNSWFADANTGGGGATTGVLKTPGDTVQGKIVRQYDVEYRDFDTKQPVILDDGSKERQFVIVLATTARNFDDGAKPGKNDDGTPVKPEEDNGERAIYVRKRVNLHGAIGEALVNAGVDPAVGLIDGGELWVQFEANETNPKTGRTFKKHRAAYKPPSATAGAFEAPAEQASAPAAQEQPAAAAPPVQTPPKVVDEPPF